MPVLGVLSYETFVAGGGAAGLVAATARGVVPAAAEGVVEDGAIRYCVDGSNPESDGLLANVGDRIALKNRGEVAQFSAVAEDLEDPGSITFALGVDWKP